MAVMKSSRESFRGLPLSRRGVATVTVSKKGWVVIPKEMREKHGIRPGDQMNILDLGSRLILKRAVDDPIETGLGFLKGEPSLTEELLKDRAWELEQEERGLPPRK
jgi:AbrB family looped-hinge helix DNA binding protein